MHIKLSVYNQEAGRLALSTVGHTSLCRLEMIHVELATVTHRDRHSKQTALLVRPTEQLPGSTSS